MTRWIINIILVIGIHFLGISAKPASRWNPIAKSRWTLFQDDIMFRNGTSIFDRNAMTNKLGRWPGGIVYYTLDDTFSESDKEIIQSAIQEFEAATCVKWMEKTDDDNDYVEIENDMGCWSELGRIGGAQSLSLESPSCMKKGVIMHEMMHAMGFLHEMSRTDRDDYVRVVWDNVIPGMEDNFQKLSSLEIDDLGLDYDYKSIMHYTAWSFAQDRNNPTLKPRRRWVPLEDLGYGQKEGVFTDLDTQKIHKFYECE